MGLGDFLKDVGDGIAYGIAAASEGVNVIDRYINPFHVERDTVQFATPKEEQEKHNRWLGQQLGVGTKAAMAGMEWSYSNGVSQPLSTAALMRAQLAGGDITSAFSADEWIRAYKAAEHISVGQALTLGGAEGVLSQASPAGLLLGMTTGFGEEAAGRAEAAIDSPLLYYQPAPSELPPGFQDLDPDEQQQYLKELGMPAVGNRYIENLRRESDFFKYSSGVTDFGFRWFADPTVVAGKAAALTRRAVVTKKRPEGGWKTEDIDGLMANSTMRRAQEFIWENRESPDLLNQLQMARESAMGPRFGAIASRLESPEEVADFLRVGLGDVSAIERLAGRRAGLEQRLAQDTERYAALDMMHTRYANNPHMQRLVSDQMDTLNRRISSDEAFVGRYNELIGYRDPTGKWVPGVTEQIDQVNLSKWSFARAEARAQAQAAYTAGAARGARERAATFQPTRPVIAPTRVPEVSTPIDTGLVSTRLWGAGDFFTSPLTVVRSFANARPNGYMRIDSIERDSIAELRGFIARVPGLSAKDRSSYMDQYLKTTTEGERMSYLDDLGGLAAARIAEKHGLDAEAGMDIYRAHLGRKYGEQENARRYSAAWKTRPSEDVPAGIRVDEFSPDGSRLVVHPNTVSRLANDHVFMDLDEYETALSRHSSAFRAIRESRAGNLDWVEDASEWFTSLFKFSVLARLGYPVRALSDDLTGQMARLGAASMAMRTGYGVKNGATNAARWAMKPFNAARESVNRAGVDYAESEIAGLEATIAERQPWAEALRAGQVRRLQTARRRTERARARLGGLPTDAPQRSVNAARRLVEKREFELQDARRAARSELPERFRPLLDAIERREFLLQYRDLAQRAADDAAAAQQMVYQKHRQPIVDGVRFPAPSEHYLQAISSDQSVQQLFTRNKQLIHGNLMRSFNHGGRVIRASEDADLHATSWARSINLQMMQDQLSRQAIQGASVRDMSRWLSSTAEGRAYRKRLGLKFVTPKELAQSAKAEADEYLPLPEIRQAALEGEVTPDHLLKAFPDPASRPEVHTGMIGNSQIEYRRAMDRVMANFYNVAVTMPADRMSRHPLFTQLYDGHLKILTKQRQQQGGWTVSDVDELASSAQQLALRDTRKLVFDIAHRSDAAAALRFVSPFFSATAESFQRWARIIADKPQIVGYAYNLYHAPSKIGGVSVGGFQFNGMQDADGNQIMADGTVMVRDQSGKLVRRLVPKGDRWIVGRLPKWVAESPIGMALGVERSTGDFRLSQNSMNLVTQGDPWFHPGVGPIVQIPVNELVRDKPREAELARHLGILPFGPQRGTGVLGEGPIGRAAGFVLPTTVKNFLTAYDTSDERYQSIKLQILQRAIFEHEQLGKPMPSSEEIADRTRNYWLFRAGSAFLQPMATDRPDPYQFYRDQYNNLRRSDPMTADQEFLSRFGESYFIFAQSQSRNLTGIPATRRAVELSQKYSDLIAELPELGALIVGPEGNGPFSPEAYSYQLTTPITPGGSEAQRVKMTAEEAIAENQKRLGWQKFIGGMDDLRAQLHGRGLRSFQDKGAEDLALAKRALISVYGEPLLPDGSPNPYYNEEWSRDYFSFDVRKNDQMAAALQRVADSELADDPRRTDIRVLGNYLAGRRAIVTLLEERGRQGLPSTLLAKANSDLAMAWGGYVDSLTESDTRFSNLYDRYLSRDLGVDVEELMGGAA